MGNIIIGLVYKLIKWYVLFPINHYKLFAVHFTINFLLSIYIYKKLYPFMTRKKKKHIKNIMFSED